MSNKANAEAQARYRARQSLKTRLFDAADAERIAHLRANCPWLDVASAPEEVAVRQHLLNHPCCFSGVTLVRKVASPGFVWRVEFSPEDPNGAVSAAVAVAAVSGTTSTSVRAVGGDETFGPDDPAVKQAQAEIAEMKRLGIWERHA